MADTEYTIEVHAEGIGTDATGDEIVALGDKIEAADKVVTRFDRALEIAGARLAEQEGAAAAASAALEEAESKYQRLDRAATRAAKKVERAAKAGKDTTQLQVAADAAAAAVLEQAQAVDRAAAEADAATAAQKKLARAYRSVEKAAGRAAEETRGTKKSFGDLFGAAGALGGPLGGLAGQISGIGDGLRAGGRKGGLILAAFAAGNALIMLSGAALGLVTALAGAVGGLLAFAVASDKATSDKLSKAWEKAKKNVKGLFEGVKTEKLVEPVNRLLGLLNKNTSAGKGLAKIFEALLNPIIDGAVEAGPLLEEMFKRMILAVLRAINWVLRLRNSVAKMIPKATREKLKQLAIALLGLGNASDTGREKISLWMSPLRLFTGAIFVAGSEIMWLVNLISGMWDSLSSDEVQSWALGILNDISDFADDLYSDALEAGGNVVDGIVQGLKDGVGAVAEAAKNLGKSIISAISKATESSSPSKIMVRMGRDDLAGALALGQKQGEPRVRRAAQGLGEAAIEGVRQARQAPQMVPPRQMATGGQARGNGNGEQTIVVQLKDGSIVINAPSNDGEELAAEVRRALLAEVEGVVVQLGAGELVAGTT
jgi:hypothetical protein